MPEFGGLQIEPRCVRCNKLTTADTTLYEMQNHRYICDLCSQKAEQEGKRISWANSAQVPMGQVNATRTPVSAEDVPVRPTTRPLRTGSLKRNLPADSLFAVMEIPLDTPLPEIREVLRKQMRIWAMKTSDPSYKQMITRLREYQGQIQDDIAFEAMREKLQEMVRGQTGAISVGGRVVMTAREFRNACEELSNGWDDGVRYLRTGELWQWILYRLNDRVLSKEAQGYQKWQVSDFRALNGMLYCLDAARPFRFYRGEAWEDVQRIPTAHTPQDLAQTCDAHWKNAEYHLYKGSMVFWLEHSQKIRDLQKYYTDAIVGYETDVRGRDQGVGLELLLEHAFPALPKPELVVTFDGQANGYTLKEWDREIDHVPVPITITNTTRGYVSASLALRSKENVRGVRWLSLSHDPQFVQGASGEKQVARENLYLYHLDELKRNATYKYSLLLSVRQEFGRPPRTQQFPVVLTPMHFYQGLRGKLNIFGLRGGLFGLLWHFASAALLALLFYQLIQKLVPQSFYSLSSDITFNTIMQDLGNGVLYVMGFLQEKFVLITAGITGFIGFWLGRKKGHKNYTAVQGARSLIGRGFWFSLLFALILVFWDQGVTLLGQIGNLSANMQILSVIFVIGASVAIWLLIFLIVLLVAGLRSLLESVVRARYASLLLPQGRA